MNYDKNPLTPHLQIYKWHISSLLSITHRIVGVLNFFAIVLICFWILSFNFNQDFFNYGTTLLSSNLGKFILITLCWSFSFFVLNEIRHLAWDLGFGFDLKISRITGLLTIIFSFIFAIILVLLGANL
ncbi:MAG: succinate dehydrogenase, cytochrome b556 subunit [Candidatus Pelagibacter sp.]|nr:succinate dehydrogenase, cytochrome b556 subunit [Candidatus Pelagibacter sp.]OUW24319.1 MAG: succinate dehydrogenase, cytochrome b556 subunit [Rickettsiales bacterium TMED174]|tara:strand:- start:469 stop:852 length:384 start_codon:yes stop_codon:yes gene_type:complete